MIAQDGMLSALLSAAEIAARCPGMTDAEAFFSRANAPALLASIEQAITESAAIPFEKKH
jgi:hypothetical protein